MSKKVLHILALFSFLNFGFATQTSFAVDNDIEKVVSDQSNESLEDLFEDDIGEIDFLDLDIDLSSIDDIEQNEEIKTLGLKEKLSLLAEILKGMTLKEKIAFISIILKSQIKEHKKEVITTATILAASTTAIIIYKKKGK